MEPFSIERLFTVTSHFLTIYIYTRPIPRGIDITMRSQAQPGRVPGASPGATAPHVTKNFMAQKVLKITQILTLRIEGL